MSEFTNPAVFEVEELPSSDCEADEEMVDILLPTHNDYMLDLLAETMNWTLHPCAASRSFFTCNWYRGKPVRFNGDKDVYQQTHLEVFGHAPWLADGVNAPLDDEELAASLAQGTICQT